MAAACYAVWFDVKFGLDTAGAGHAAAALPSLQKSVSTSQASR